MKAAKFVVWNRLEEYGLCTKLCEILAFWEEKIVVKIECSRVDDKWSCRKLVKWYELLNRVDLEVYFIKIAWIFIEIQKLFPNHLF